MPPANYERELGRIEAEVKEVKEDVEEVRDKQEETNLRLDETNRRLERIERQNSEYKTQLETAVEILRSLTTLLRVAKWVGGAIVALAAVWEALKQLGWRK